jgi:energy-coupling factor transport system substrate-specific component
LRHLKKASIIKIGVFAALIILLLFTAFENNGSYAVTSFLFIVLMLVPFFYSFEAHRPMARQLVPIAVLAAVAALGRVAFAALPDVKPTSAVVIIAGISFGPEAGFITGATAALTSNIFFGQGPFTPWQMFAWGIMGYCAGLFSHHGLLRKRLLICIFGFVWGFLYGWIMDLWQVLGFVSTINTKSVLLTYAASFYLDLTHAVSTAIFLLLVAKPWTKILNRVKIKYGLDENNSN